MQHDFQSAENYAVFMDLPVIFSPKLDFWIVSIQMGGYCPDRSVCCTMTNRTVEMRWFEIDTCAVFIRNTFEDETVSLSCVTRLRVGQRPV